MSSSSKLSAAAVARQQPLTPLSPATLSMPAVPEKIVALPITPPDFGEVEAAAISVQALSTAVHVISTERFALEHLEDLYQNDPIAREGFAHAVESLCKSITNGGKLVISGVGKSAKIAEKIVATMNSLSIQCSFLHPIEALHGDLGMIRSIDTILLITFSGRTPELLSLLPHLPSSCPLLVLTAHTVPHTCLLLERRSSNSILLPAPIPVSEHASFGIRAPTTSTTVALALGDALALAAGRRLHTIPGRGPSEVFLANHPGGAIGASVSETGPKRISHIATLVRNIKVISAVDDEVHDSCLTDIVCAAVRSPGGWVLTDPYRVIAPRQIQNVMKGASNLNAPISSLDRSVIIEKGDWISVLGKWSIEECREWIRRMREEERGRGFLKQGTILGVVDEEGTVSGVVEIEDVWGEDWGECG